MSINSLLFTARDSLISHQMAISITGSNIANVNTPGYNRQRADLVTIGSLNVQGFDSQVGVTVSQVTRIFDRFIESQLVQQEQATGYSDTMLKLLQNMEIVLDDTSGGGLNEHLDRLWASWEDLARNPAGKLERSALLSTAETLCGAFISYKQNLDAINAEVNSGIADVVSLINNKMLEIADINAQVIKEGTSTGDLNNIMDRRATALRELGSMINISYLEMGNGTINVSMANGEPLLIGASVHTLSVVVTGGQSKIFNANSSTSVNGSITGGQLGAYLEVQQDILPYYINGMNDLTNSMALHVNTLHSGGFDTYGNMGLNFFVIKDAANPSGSLSVNSLLAADINRIAASASISGDGENATRLAAIRNTLLMDGGKTSLSSFLATMVGELGRQTANAKTNSEHQTAILNYLNNQRESVSGVSIDEEMIMLIKYQMGYNAAGKLAGMVNDMLDTLMNVVQ
jgi:flagellar hook-associated protein 1 FlgK